jgi:ABC-type phosphate transport system substrate-binding protein
MVHEVVRRKSLGRCLALGVLIAGCSMQTVSVAWAADYAVIANAGVPGTSVSKADLKAIFLGDKTTWSNGAPITVVVLEEGAAHKAFLEDVLGKTPAQFDNYWKKLVFTGKATPPRSFADAAALASYVAKEPGAVGYIAAGTPAGSAKTLKVE